jgi:hypothetical protein
VKVSTLISKLSALDQDAEVLLLAGCADISDAEELRRVEPQSDWRCEVHFRDDGQSKSYRAPASFGALTDFDEHYDRTVKQRVVLLAAHDTNLNYMFEGDFQSEARKLSPEWIEQETLRRNRAMLEDGTLISRELLLRLLTMSAEELDGLVERGDVFEILIDGTLYYPSVFANPRINARRLRAVSRLLQPLSASVRLNFLLSEWHYLDGRRPIEMLDDVDEYRQVRGYAKVRAAESTRTAVVFYEGLHESPPVAAKPLYTAAAELDPRRPLWSRARATLSEYGYESPHAPYPISTLFTAFVEKTFEGQGGGVLEGVVCMHGVEEGWRIAATFPPAITASPDEQLRCEQQDIVTVAKAAFDYLARLTANTR